MSIKKKLLKKKDRCQVTFTLPKDIVNGARQVAVLGDFNQWNPEAHPMNHLKNGSFKTSLELEKGHSYQFRYLVDGNHWDNDPEADEEVANFHGSLNSLIHT